MWGLYVKKRGTLNLGMRMEYLMARQAAVIARGYVKDPEKVKVQNYLRFHEDDKPDPVAMTPTMQAKMFAGMLNRK